MLVISYTRELIRHGSLQVVSNCFVVSMKLKVKSFLVRALTLKNKKFKIKSKAKRIIGYLVSLSNLFLIVIDKI